MNPLYNDYYAGAEVKVRGSKPGDSVTMRGEAMVYGITQIKNAPNKAVAEAFIEFVTSEEGRKILDRMGQGAVGTPE